jgi:hypothetical protein
LFHALPLRPCLTIFFIFFPFSADALVLRDCGHVLLIITLFILEPLLDLVRGEVGRSIDALVEARASTALSAVSPLPANTLLRSKATRSTTTSKRLLPTQAHSVTLHEAAHAKIELLA